MNGSNGTYNKDFDLLGELALMRLQIDRLIHLEVPITTEVRVRLHLALDHVDDAIKHHEKWQQTKAIEAASANVRRIAV